jgi:2-iminobutanoate/2-iminopropanoate deaminase
MMITFAAEKLLTGLRLIAAGTGLLIASYTPLMAAKPSAPGGATSQVQTSSGERSMSQCATDQRRYLRLPEELERLWGLSQAVRIGSTIHFAGFLALDEKGNVEGKTLEAQTRAVYAHIDHALGYFGATRTDIVDETVYVRSMDAVNAGGLMPRNAFFAAVSPPPPMTLIGVTELAHPAALVEVKITVVVKC